MQDSEEWEMRDASGTLPATPADGWTLDNLPPTCPSTLS
jgi:hypothetical protein